MKKKYLITALIVLFLSFFFGIETMAFNLLYLQQNEKVVTIKADIDCDNCPAKVKRQLSYIKGIKEVQTDVNKQHIIVIFDPNKTTEQIILKEIRKLNMGGEIVGFWTKSPFNLELANNKTK